MVQIPFVDAWSVRRVDEAEAAARPVTLPHDAMIGERRSPDGGTTHHGGYFPGGRYVYARSWVAPELAPGSRVALVFEASYGATVVRVDGVDVAAWDSPYREVRVEMTDVVRSGGEHRIEVEVDNTAVPNSRWYTGSGLYRPVWLVIEDAARFAPDGVRVHTRSVSENLAVVDVELLVELPAGTGERVEALVELRDGADVVVSVVAQVSDGRASAELTVRDPRPWSDVDPALYTACAQLRVAGRVADERELRVGLRVVELDPVNGLRVNGRPVLLRGACLHHDSGLLGAATFAAAERRRVTILKENGFNAVRSAHNPASSALLDACDELGLYVVDELTDVWTQHKTPHDAADRFEQLWRDDARAMVARSRNHASVLMYSLGNEIPETSNESGIRVAHLVSDFVKGLDPHRPTMLAVNLMLNVMASIGAGPFDDGSAATEKKARKRSGASSEAANKMAARVGQLMQVGARLPWADRVSRGAFATVDVAGYNYAWSRYGVDSTKYPQRVIVGSESMPFDIARIWPRVEEHAAVIGDFMWTGWDYLGEAGIGSWTYGTDPARGMMKPYPHVLAGCGVIDITGLPGAPMLLARAAWGELDGPAIAVRPLTHWGEKAHISPWRKTDAVQSWAWAGCEGRTAEIEVYSAADEVRLLLNGRLVGTRPAGRRRGFVARFRVPYEPGELTAVDLRAGGETARSSLVSAHPDLHVRLTPDRAVLRPDGQDLVHLVIDLADARGTAEWAVDDRVHVDVSGPANLAALGSAAQACEGSYCDPDHETWYGRAMAIVRAGSEPGAITVRVTSARHGSAEVELRSEGVLAATRAA